MRENQNMARRHIALDTVCAFIVLFVGIIFLALSFSFNYKNGLPILSAVLLASLLYLSFRNKLAKGITLTDFRFGDEVRLLSHVIFLISLSLSIWVLWNNLYYRPPLYFFFVLVAVAAILLNIFSLDETKGKHSAIVLLKIIALSLSVYVGVYHQFPGIYGIDPWYHNQIIQETVNLGHITEGQIVANDYFPFPNFHLAGATMQIVTGLSTYNAIFASTGVMVAFSSLFVFLIGQKLASTRAGLLAALIFPLTSVVIALGTAIIAMSLGFCFFTAIFYLIICRNNRTVSNNALVLLLSLALIFTHTVAALITLLSIIVAFVAVKLYKALNRSAISYETVSLALIGFFALAMFAKWIQVPPGSPAFFDFTLSQLADSLQTGTKFILAEPGVTKTVPFALTVLNQGGYLILLALAIIGALRFLHSDNINMNGLALAFVAVMLIAIPYSFELFSLEDILPGRWSFFLYIPLSLLAMIALLSISVLLRERIVKLTFITVIVLGVTWMTITSSGANNDSSLVFNNAVRIGYTQSELATVKTLSSIGANRPMTDAFYAYAFPFLVNPDEYQEMTGSDSRVFIQRNYYLHSPEWNQYYMVRIRSSMAGYRTEDSTKVLVSEYIEKQKINSWPLIYTNNNVQVYSNAVVVLWNK